jgi:hypothetical protein
MINKELTDSQIKLIHVCSEIAIMHRNGFVADMEYKVLIVNGLIDKLLFIQQDVDSEFIKRCNAKECRLWLLSLISSK